MSGVRRTLLGVMLIATICAAPAAADVTQPGQPAAGPGSSDYAHKDVRVTAGGEGNDAWYVFEPAGPAPKTAPLAVVTHGYFEFAGNSSQYALSEHTARKGTVVIYTRWQTGIADPCPGPFDIELCITSEVNGIKGAIDFLKSHPDHVQPDLSRTSYFAHSFGGIITANMLNRWQSLGVPKPRVMFLDDPHDGGYTGAYEPALDDDLSGIPSATLVQCHSGAHGVFDDSYTGTGDPDQLGQPQADGSCNALFPKLTSIPEANKDLVMTSEDDHGTPALTSDHGVCRGPTGGIDAVDAYDYGFCWKTWDALRSCANEGTFCRYALGDTPEHRFIGTWSDGTPIVGLKIQKEAPIRAEPVPDRPAAPPPNEKPNAVIAKVARRGVRGTATDDDAVLKVAVRVDGRARKAKGTTSWSLKRRLKKGRHRIVVRVMDSDGVWARTAKRARVR